MKKYIKKRLYEDLRRYDIMLESYSDLQFNDGRLNKIGPNTIYMGDEPIVDFGIGQIGNIDVAGTTIPNGLYLQGGYNAVSQGRGYGSIGLKFIFDKLPRIENVLVQCYNTACPFWAKMGGEVIASKDIGKGTMLHTMVINRNSLPN